MSTDRSDELHDQLDPDEEIRWHERGPIEASRRQAKWAVVSVALLLSLPAVLVGVVAFGTVTDSAPVAALGALLVLGVLTYGAYALTTGRIGRREYAITDRRIVKGDGWLGKSFETIPWENVESIDFRRHDYQRIDVRTTSGLSTKALMPLFHVRLRFFDAHAAYEPMLQAWKEATGGPDPPTDVGEAEALAADRRNLPENARSELDPGETVIWGAPRSESLSDRAVVGMATLVGAVVAVLSFLLGSLFVPALLGTATAVPALLVASVLVGAGLGGGTYAMQHRWEGNRTRTEYVVTDDRLVETVGHETREIAWDDVAAVQRRRDRLRVFTRDPTEIDPEGDRFGFQVGQQRQVKPADMVLRVPDTQRAYWAIRAANPAEVFDDETRTTSREVP